MITPEPPMQLGETLRGTDPANTSTLINGHWLGQEFIFPASASVSGQLRGQKARKTGRTIRARLVRNVAGVAVLGKRVVKFAEAAGYSDFETIDGYCAVKADAHLAFSDPNLPSAGCADDDIMWVIIEGPTTVLSPFEAGGFDKAIAVGDPLVGATGSTTGTSGVGRVSVGGVLAGGSLAATEAFNHSRNSLGRALSARTTGETNADILVDACIRI